MMGACRWASSAALTGALLATGCAETPLDATLLEQEPPVPLPALCPTTTPVDAELYHVVSKTTGACLSSGVPTQIEVTPDVMGYTVELDPECRDIPEQRWQLIADADGALSFGPDEWEIRNQALNWNLDLEGARFFDGTEALLYTPHDLSNQRFWFDPIGDDVRIRASMGLTENSCLQDMLKGIGDAMRDNAVELHGCSLTRPTQLWILSPLQCDEDE